MKIQKLTQKIQWKDGQTVSQKPEKYLILKVCPQKLFKAWRNSIVAVDWMKDGKLRSPDTLDETLRSQYEFVLKDATNDKKLDRPLIGLGIFDNLEIATARATAYFCALHDADEIELRCSTLDEKLILKLLEL